MHCERMRFPHRAFTLVSCVKPRRVALYLETQIRTTCCSIFGLKILMRKRCLSSSPPPQTGRLETAITLGESSADERKESTRHCPPPSTPSPTASPLFFHPGNSSGPDSPLSELIAEAGSRLGCWLVSCFVLLRLPPACACFSSVLYFTRRTPSPRSRKPPASLQV